MSAWYSAAKSSAQVIVALVPPALYCDCRRVWVIRAVRLISGDVTAVGTRMLTCTMSPGLAPAQNCQASHDEAFAALAAALTVISCTRLAGLA